MGNNDRERQDKTVKREESWNACACLCDAYKKEGIHVLLVEEIKDKQEERSFE